MTYTLTKRLQRTLDRVPQVVDGREEAALLRRKGQHAIDMVAVMLEEPHRYVRKSIDYQCVKVIEEMITILEQKNDMVEILGSFYELVSTISFLQQAMEEAKSLGCPELAAAIQESFPILAATKSNGAAVPKEVLRLNTYV